MESVIVRYLTTALAFLLIVVATAGGSASASDGEAGTPQTDFAIGGGTYLLDLPEVPLQFRVHFSFGARALDGGPVPAATGSFFWNDTVNDQFIRARVICLSVDGGEAFLVGQIVDSEDPVNIGLFAGAKVIDSGLPGAQGDRFHLEFVSFPFEGMCIPRQDPFAFEVVSGNVIVHDALP